MNTGKKSEDKSYACCDDSKMSCDACSFEDSIKVEDKENE